MRPLARLLSFTRELTRGLLRRHRMADQTAEELRFHIDAHAQDLITRGVPPGEAHRRAAAAAGHPENLHERRRESLGLRLCDELWADLRYGLRGLRRNPGFATIAILSLALAIGAATAMFSLVYATILDAFPYPDADRIVTLTEHAPGDDSDDAPVLGPGQRAMMLKTGAFSDVMGTGMVSALIPVGGRDYTNFMVITPNAGSLLGARALYGRPLQSSDRGPAGQVAVLNYAYWKLAFHGDPLAVGRSFPFDSKRFTIVGVMPRWYNLGGGADIYLPSTQFEHGWRMTVTARLKPGVSKVQALAAIQPLLTQVAKQNPKEYPAGTIFDLVTLREQYTSTSKFVRSLPMLLLSVLILLLIGCANCCMLLLARGTARQHEFAMRAAIGATPARLVRQLLVESLSIALAGSAGGVVLAYALARLPLWLSPGMFPLGSFIHVNLPVLCFAVATAGLLGVASGLLPALRAAHPRIAAVLQASYRRAHSGRGYRILRTLMAAQIACTLVLLTLAGASAAGFLNILQLRLGFSPHNIALVQVADDNRLSWTEHMAQLASAHRLLASVPGVDRVGVSANLPPTAGGRQPVEVPGRSLLNSEQVRTDFVGAEYFTTLHMPVLAGRVWSQAEAAEGLPVGVVNQAFAQRLTSGRSPLGQIVRLPGLADAVKNRGNHISLPAQSGRIEVVGVVGNALNMGLDQPLQPEIYLNAGIDPQRAVWFLVHTRTDPAQFRVAIQKAVAPLQQQDYVIVLPDSLRQQIESAPYWQQQRLVSILFGLYAGIALALALVGLYSTAQYIALQRRGELGIRLALGATRGHVRWLVLRGNLLVIAYAAVAGVLLSLVARAGIARWMTGSSQSPVVLLAAACLLILVSLAACLAPAERAARLNPNEVLRAE